MYRALFHSCLIGLVLIPLLSSGQQIKIGLFSSLKPRNLLLSAASGAYSLMSAEQEILILQPGQSLYIFASDSGMLVKSTETEIGIFDSLRLKALLPASYFKLLCLVPTSREQWYEGSLELAADSGKVKLINELDFESYLGGVVEAETGPEQEPEFYKVQAVICRTFALANYNKHKKSGFNLCDQIHCQVYKGRPNSNPEIVRAVAGTSSQIIVDKKLNLTDAVFHSNCGGFTHNSEDYWKESVPYLRAVTDSFCSEGAHASWKLVLPRDKWLNYLAGTYSISLSDTALCDAVCNYSAATRSEFLLDPVYRIGLRRIRSDWNLRSTFFSISPEGDNVVFTGRGYGHGVGLCQEGAMQMARRGYTYTDILHYYFREVFLIPKDMLSYLTGY